MSLRAGRQETDSINVPQAVVAFISAVSMVVLTILAVFATTHNIKWSTTPSNEARKPPSEAPKFGMLHQTLFGAVSDAATLKKQEMAHLSSYGWVDESKGVTHIPIELAKRKIVEGHAK